MAATELSVCNAATTTCSNSLHFQRLQGRYYLNQVFFVPGWCHRWWTPMLTTNEATANCKLKVAFQFPSLSPSQWPLLQINSDLSVLVAHVPPSQHTNPLTSPLSLASSMRYGYAAPAMRL
jgi:hypothetical protein